MASRITTCDKCDSRNIKTLNSESKRTVKRPIVYVKVECEDCGHKFEYPSATDWGKRKGIMY